MSLRPSLALAAAALFFASDLDLARADEPAVQAPVQHEAPPHESAEAEARASEPVGLDAALFGPPGPAPAADQVDALTLDIGSRMRCPVCQALSVTASQSESAVSMKARVRELVAMGYTEPQIRAYFISRYGEWIVLDPPKDGLNWLLWGTPVVLLVVGLGLVIGTSARKAPAAAPAAPAKPEDDPYRKALLAELED